MAPSDWFDILRVVWVFLIVVQGVRVVRAVVRKYRGAPLSLEEASWLVVITLVLVGGWSALTALGQRFGL
jgi:hypothetical protein